MNQVWTWFNPVHSISILWYGTAINRHKPVQPSIYHLVVGVYYWSGSWGNLLFRGMLRIYNAKGCIYISILSLSWAFLWKVDFLRIPTSSTRWYILGCTCLCQFIAVPYHSMVCTEMKLCCPYHNWVHTISYHDIKSMYQDKLVCSWMYWNMLCKILDQYVLKQSRYIHVC